MQPFKANTMIGNRYWLIEEISVSPERGQRVWAVMDTHTNQRLIGKFSNNGQVEWFNDNRPPRPVTEEVLPVAGTTLPPTPTPRPAAKPVAVAAKPTTTSPVTAAPGPGSGRRAMYFLGMLLLVGAAFAGYTKRDALTGFFKAETTPAAADSATVDAAPAAVAVDSVAPAPEATVAGALPTVPLSPFINRTMATGWSVKQVSQMLKQLKKLPLAQHPVLFAEAGRVFTTFRTKSPDEDLIDSLYMAYATCGALSLQAHEQNADPTSKQYAIWWYQTAYAISPRPEVAGLLNRLRGIIPKPPVRNVPTRPASPGFLPDPELNQ